MNQSIRITIVIKIGFNNNFFIITFCEHQYCDFCEELIINTIL